MRILNIIKLSTLSMIASSCLFGVNLPNIDSIQKSIEVPKEIEDIQKAKQEPIIEIGKKELAPALSDDKSGKTIIVDDVQIEGNSVIDANELKQLLQNSIKQELTFSKLQELASIITKHYRQKGYFVARAYIPRQDIKANNNTLKIVIIEGSYGDFRLTNNSLNNNETVQAMFDDAKHRCNVVSVDTLERAMLIINEAPGSIVTQADVAPGKIVGTSDFIVKTEKSNRFGGYIVADNSGSKYTSQNRIMGGVTINSPRGYADKLSLTGLVSEDKHLENYKIAYSIPLAPNGLRMELSRSKTDYELVELDNIEDKTMNGTSSANEVVFSYPIIKTKNQSLNFLASYDLKYMSDYNNEDITKQKKVKLGTVGLNYSKNHSMFGFDAKSTIDGTFTFGDLDILDESSRTADEAGAQTIGDYQKININASLNIAFNPIYSLQTSIKSQIALDNKNLDGSEDISIGGTAGVRAYPDGEYSAENGVIFQATLFGNIKSLNTTNTTHKLGVFYDVGTADMSDSSKDIEFKRRTLQDAGIGYYLNHKDMFAKVEYARTIGSKIQTEHIGDDSRVILQAGWVF